MSDAEVKAVLKEAKKLLVEEKHEEAMELCEKHIEDGVKDYMLYCLAALANANQNYPIDASTHYFDAIKLDAEKPIAWQGLFKLYDTVGLKVDVRAVEAADRVITISETEEKKAYARSRRREFLLELRNFAAIKEDLGDQSDFLQKVITVVMGRETKSETEKALLSSCFSTLGDAVFQDPALNLQYVKYIYEISSSTPSWSWAVEKFCQQHKVADPWIMARIEHLLSVAALKDGTLPEELSDFYSDVYDGDEDAFAFSLLNALADDDIGDAADLVEGQPDTKVLVLPTVYASIRVLFEDENFERCLTCIAWSQLRCKEPEISNLLIGMKARCLLSIGDRQSIRLGCELCPLDERFALTDFLLRLRTGETVDVESLKDATERSRAEIAVRLHASDFAGALKASEALVSSKHRDDVLLRSEALIRSGKAAEAVQILARVAKDHPRCSRAFFLLGHGLRGSNKTKAQSCIERAVKIRPKNEEYVHLLDDLLEESGGDAHVRVQLLVALETRPDWAQRRLAQLFMVTGQVEQAIGCIQHQLRVDPNDADAWASLASAYCARGSLQAAVNAYEQAATLRPESDFAVPMLQVLLRLGQNETVIEKCAAWRANNPGYSSDTATTPNRMLVGLAEAQATLIIAKSVVGDRRIELLNTVLNIVGTIVEHRPGFALPYKLLADALSFAAGFNVEARKRIQIPTIVASGSGPQESESLWSTVCSLYASALAINRGLPAIWADLGVALTQRADYEHEKKYAERAIDCLQQAIRLTADAQARSLFYTKLASASRAAGGSLDREQHFLIRAIQLNRVNDEAWCRLGILYAQSGAEQRALARSALESALEANPESAATWSCYVSFQAEVAEGCLARADAADTLETSANMQSIDLLKKHAEDSFTQALTYAPTELAVENLTDMICSLPKQYDASASRVNFEQVLGLFDRSDRNPDFILRLALLAEQFGFLPEAANLLRTLDQKIVGVHLERILLSASSSSTSLPEEASPKLANLRRLAEMESSKLCQELLQRVPLYDQILSQLPLAGEDGDRNFAEMCQQRRAEINIALIVATTILNNIPITRESVSALHNMRPRHELVDVWPTEIDSELTNETHYLEQDGEEPFRLRHRTAKDLFEVLSRRREEWIAAHPDEMAKTNMSADELESVLADTALVE